MKVDEEQIKRTLGRNVERIVTEAEFWKKLRSGRQLRIKHGVDVTNPLLHIGHAVNYWKMREFQELGHKVVFLIGDLTTQIGDPTGKSKIRPEISPETIKENSKQLNLKMNNPIPNLRYIFCSGEALQLNQVRQCHTLLSNSEIYFDIHIMNIHLNFEI